MNLTPHFEVGNLVVISNSRYLVMAYTEKNVVLLPLDQTGPVLVISPPYVRNS